MSQFEKHYFLTRQKPLSISGNFSSGQPKTTLDISYALQKNKQDYWLQMEYRKLDVLVSELEKELAAVKQLRTQLENYKAEFSIEVENEATEKIKEVLSQIDKLFK